MYNEEKGKKKVSKVDYISAFIGLSCSALATSFGIDGFLDAIIIAVATAWLSSLILKRFIKT